MDLITMNQHHLISKYAHPFVWLCVCPPLAQGLFLGIRNHGIILVIYCHGNTRLQGRVLSIFAIVVGTGPSV